MKRIKSNKPKTSRKRVKKSTPKKKHVTGFYPGNQLWKVRSSHGRNPKFPSPEKLLNACLEYFEWQTDNPWYEYRVAGSYKGEAVIDNVPKLIPFTLGSLCIFLDITHTCWMDYRSNKGEGFSRVCQYVENIIREQKFNGAAAGFFNHAIIARDLGLVDKSDITSKGDKLENQNVIVLPAKEEI